MESSIERLRKNAEDAKRVCQIVEIEFAGPTYQVEVFDTRSQESYWPFLQFDSEGDLKDAFCSCPVPECLHLARALEGVLADNGIPLHIQFENSFWNQFCKLLGDHSGYEKRFLKKCAEGCYCFENQVSFEIKAKTKEAALKLESLAEEKRKETPETSIKFSDLNQEEIDRWREGRASPFLRYLLSFWFELAKWMTKLAEKAFLEFKEDDKGVPTEFFLDFQEFTIHCALREKDLIALIPFLFKVNSSLMVFKPTLEKIKNIDFDERTQKFRIEHEKEGFRDFRDAKSVGDWAYFSQVGFYPMYGKTFLDREVILKEEIPLFLNEYAAQVAKFLPVNQEILPLNYTLYFDDKWNLHLIAYLFEKNDLMQKGSGLFQNWAYLEGKGFFCVNHVLFSNVETILSSSNVSSFVNHNRVFLNSQEGFQTHLASIETQLTYTLSEKGYLSFYAKAEADSNELRDFGDWVYYAGQGFFSKKHAKLGNTVKPGLEIHPDNISAFIKNNREEIEAIPNFFSSEIPFKERALEISMKSSSSLLVKPVYTLHSKFLNKKIRIFGEFVYLEGRGFCELPSSMRLPREYANPIVIREWEMAEFFEEKLPLLQKYLLKIDSSLRKPHRIDLHVNYLERKTGGGLKAAFYYFTEFGSVAATDLLDSLKHKRRFHFSEAGLLDLHTEAFSWLHQFKHRFQSDLDTLDLSSLEFFRLDAAYPLHYPSITQPAAATTQELLKELREFSVREPPNIKGLKSQLRHYQQNGLHWLWFLYKNGLSGLLCDDMGLGKTHQSMALIAAILNQEKSQSRRFLIVCPTSVIYHWQDKLETFLPHLKVHTFHGQKRRLRNLPKTGVILTSYGIVRLEKDRLKKILFEAAFFDEVQVAKNPHSRVHDALKHLQVQMRIGLTGTPIENNLRELKSLFDCVLPGFMPSEARFREMFIYPIERDFNEEKKALLTRMIRPFVLRRKKTEVLEELPEKSEDKSYCELSDEQIKLYKESLEISQDSLIADLKNENKNVNYLHVFSLLSRLKQICDHPALVHKDPKNYKGYRSGKWDLFIELLNEAHESAQKVVVFSQYLYMLDIIENYLQETKRGYAQIRGDTLNRKEELQRFQEDPGCTVFIGSLQAAGLGIDLTAASVVILYDRWWNAARENQAIDRVHRMGQKRGVQVYKLITKQTIEEKIDRMIVRKGRLLEEIVTADDQAVLKKFTRSELLDLLYFTL